MTAPVGIVGGGAWGTALAVRLGRRHTAVRLWVREEQTAHNIMTHRENRVFLPSIPVPETVQASTDMADLKDSEILLMAPPSQHMGTTLDALRPHLRSEAVLVVCSKGLDPHTLQLMSQVIEDRGVMQVAVLSGPSFAHEVDSPMALTLAHAPGAQHLVEALGHGDMRLYPTYDLIGAQVGGVMKNVLAIASGIVHGRALGESPAAALMARGFAEMRRLGHALGAQEETLCGPAGLGDLILTCSSSRSRNMSLGIALGEGRTVQETLAERPTITEGFYNAQNVCALAAQHQVELPICEAVNAILHKGWDVSQAIDSLLRRPLRPAS